MKRETDVLKQYLLKIGLLVASMCFSIFIFYFFIDDMILQFNLPYLFILLRIILGVVVYIVLVGIVKGELPKKLTVFIGLLYLGILYSAVLLRSPGIQGINIDPTTLISDLKNDRITVIANFLGFIPAGLFLKLLFMKVKFRWLVLYGFLSSAFIEVIQYILHLGISDVIDILLNGSGFAIGVLMSSLICKIKWSSRSSC